MEVIALLLNGYMGRVTGHRLLCSLGGLVSALVGMVLIVALPESNNIGRLIGYYMTQASPTSFVALLSMIGSNVAGYTKKTTVAALYLIGYCVGNILGRWSVDYYLLRDTKAFLTSDCPGPQTFRPKDAPRYIPAEITIIVCCGVAICIMLFIFWWYKKENKRKLMIQAHPDYVRVENQECVGRVNLLLRLLTRFSAQISRFDRPRKPLLYVFYLGISERMGLIGDCWGTLISCPFSFYHSRAVGLAEIVYLDSSSDTYKDFSIG